jgi:hypothetical protein
MAEFNGTLREKGPANLSRKIGEENNVTKDVTINVTKVVTGRNQNQNQNQNQRLFHR